MASHAGPGRQDRGRHSSPLPSTTSSMPRTLKIAYTVNGKAITADLTSFQSSNYAETQRRATEFPVGSLREIRYDPNNPEQARIGAGWNRRFFAVPLITLGCGLLFGLLAVGFFIAARFGKQVRQPSS